MSLLESKAYKSTFKNPIAQIQSKIPFGFKELNRLE
jgi:hypothetical protein